ncbi:MAG: undecaprenyldiphospho-muramoylpentapeptide beta-N-acetylglucosaminyltransferase [Ignavibacteriae bacterium]|nr:undecaprenyldiphospho-muramoylpentapeptide beta-N-acetylglucosaminyltransferase [Ignavibacteriota bacterium]
MAEIRVIFAGGGTGGHLFPAIAIADELKRLVPDAELLFIGTKNKIEARVVPQKEFAFRTIWISGFHRRLRLSNFLFPLKVVVSLVQSYSIIKQFKPDVVIGTGGYVSGPIVYAASVMKIPTLIHEQNSYPGVTTRMLGNRVKQVCITFEQAKKYLKRVDNVVLTGNPTRGSLEKVHQSEAFNYFGFDSSGKQKTLLVFGGSLGATTINNAVVQQLEKYIGQGFRIIWQTGKEDIERVKTSSNKIAKEHLWVNAFIDRMDYAYAISDIVICRAGATTIAELTRLGKPAILIPYPFAAADHQTENAKAMTESGAALMVRDSEAKERLFDVVQSLLNDTEKLQAMSIASKQLGKPNAAEEIARRIIELGRRK